MLYALLCYHSEDAVCSWSQQEDAAVMAKLAIVQDKLAKAGKLGPVARLMPTTAATTSGCRSTGWSRTIPPLLPANFAVNVGEIAG